MNVKVFALAIKNMTKWLSESLLGFQYPLNLIYT